jgi:hypothetical protein
LLRGKTLLAMDDPRAARRAFEEAQKSEQNDIAMSAHGYVTLLSRSKLSTFMPRTGNKTPINIADPKNQSAAFNALLEDELPRFEKEAEAAAKANNLNPAIALVPKLLELAAIEFAATGEYERLRPLGKEVGDHARTLISNELAAQDQKITAIENMANQLIDTGGYRGHGTRGRRGGWWNSDVTRRGLVSDERESLYQLVEYLQKVEDTTRRGLSVAKAVNGETPAWEALVQEAERVKNHAQYVLESEGVRTATDTTRR